MYSENQNVQQFGFSSKETGADTDGMENFKRRQIDVIGSNENNYLVVKLKLRQP